MSVLSVNLNKIAWLRNARNGRRPDLLDAARTVIDAGVKGITVHPRPDQRHIRVDDVYNLAELLKDYPDVEYNIEGNPQAGPRDNGYPGFDAFIRDTKPAQATLVPDSDNQLTSDHGWDLTDPIPALQEKIALYQSYGSRVSIFMDPVAHHIKAAQEHGTDRIELYTGPFADEFAQSGATSTATLAALEEYTTAAQYAAQLGLGVNAGHDLDLHNLTLLRTISEVAEVSIGHALIADALEMGLDTAVRAYLRVLSQE